MNILNHDGAALVIETPVGAYGIYYEQLESYNFYKDINKRIRDRERQKLMPLGKLCYALIANGAIE